jgi:hypothetical protein
MGQSWVTVRDSARQGTLRANDPSARDVVEHWEQFLDYVALGLSQDLGREVVPTRSRNQTLADRVDAHVRRLAANGQLAGTLRVPDAAGPVTVIADLRTRLVTTSVDVAAPREGRQLTRVNWIVRQLNEAPAQLRVSASFVNARDTSSALLGEIREQQQRLLHAVDPKREIRSFELAWNRRLGEGNGRGAGSFVAETRQQVIDFYGEVVQNVASWQPRAPRLPDSPEAVPETPQPEPPPFVVADEREIGEARLPDADEPTGDPWKPVDATRDEDSADEEPSS